MASLDRGVPCAAAHGGSMSLTRAAVALLVGGVGVLLVSWPAIAHAGGLPAANGASSEVVAVDRIEQSGSLNSVVLGVEGMAQARVEVDLLAEAMSAEADAAATGFGSGVEHVDAEAEAVSAVDEAELLARADLDRRFEQRWVSIEPGQRLGMGAVVRTGVRANVVLRIGLNATVRVNALSRVSIDESLLMVAGADDGSGAMVIDGAASPVEDASGAGVLRTRLDLQAGDVDVRVDHIGDFANDFEITTPEATLAVRGTNFSAGFDALSGLRVQGAETNSLRAIEIAYVEQEMTVGLSESGVDGALRDPALLALAATVARPNEGVAPRTFRERIGRPNAGAVTLGGVDLNVPVELREGDIERSNRSSFSARVDESAGLQ